MSNQDTNSASESRTDTLTPSQQIMADFRKSLAGRTRERHHKELGDFREYLKKNGKRVGNLATDAANWTSITSSDVERFLRELGGKGYKITSIRDKFYTIRNYARLAMQGGFFSVSEFKYLGDIKLGDILVEFKAQNLPSLSKEKSEPFLLTKDHVRQLLAQPGTFRGKADALLLALLLYVGLWPREISALNRRSIDLERGILTFYDYHFGEEQVSKLNNPTLEIARHYLQEPSPYEALFVGNRKESTTELRLTDRAINARIRVLGNQVGIEALSPHDCHLYWERYYKYAKDQADNENNEFPDAKLPFRRKARPDLFNRRMFESALLSQGVPDSLVSQMISDIRLLIPLLIQQIGEETFRKIAIEYRSKLILGSETEIWEQTVHHLVTWAENELRPYFSKNLPSGLLNETKE